MLKFHQHTLFRTNQKVYYDELEAVKDGMTGIPDHLKGIFINC